MWSVAFDLIKRLCADNISYLVGFYSLSYNKKDVIVLSVFL